MKNIKNFFGITSVPKEYIQKGVLAGPNGVPLTLTRHEGAVNVVLKHFYNEDRILLGWTKESASKYKWFPKKGYKEGSPLKGNILITESVDVADTVIIK